MIYRPLVCMKCGMMGRGRAVAASAWYRCPCCGDWIIPPIGGPLIFDMSVPCGHETIDLMNWN